MKIIRCLWCFRNAIKRIKTREKTIFLTFDDGPTPIVTEKVLNLLEKYNAKATFFCLGEKAEQNPEIIKLILEKGHSIGNHGYYHQNAFKTSKKLWVENITKKSLVSPSKLIRPPYGNIFPSQFYQLSKDNKIVFWDVMTYDFDATITIAEIKKIIVLFVRNGSIVVFHDTAKAETKMLTSLEFLLKYFSELLYNFEKIY